MACRPFGSVAYVRHRPARARASDRPAARASGRRRPAQSTSAAHNPWLWATAAVAVIAIALGVWGLNERSNADDAKSDLQRRRSRPRRRRRPP